VTETDHLPGQEEDHLTTEVEDVVVVVVVEIEVADTPTSPDALSIASKSEDCHPLAAGRTSRTISVRLVTCITLKCTVTDQELSSSLDRKTWIQPLRNSTTPSSSLTREKLPTSQ